MSKNLNKKEIEKFSRQIILKNIGKLFPGPSKTTRAYTLKEKGIINAAKERGFKVVKKKLNQAPFYFSKLIEFEKIK